MTEEAKPVVSVEKLVKVYLKMKQTRAELSAEFTKQDERIKEQMDQVKSALLEYCKDQNVESVRTAEGLFYRTTRTNYWTNDWESMHRFVRDHQVPDLLERRIHQTNMKTWIQDNPGLLPEGLNNESRYSATVRRSK